MDTAATNAGTSSQAATGLSPFERLPEDLVRSINELAQNPWLGYACPMFYNYFESQTEIRIEESAKRHKRKAVEKKHTSNVNQRIKLVREAFEIPPNYCLAYKPPFENTDYERRFGELANLPWFMKAVFGSRDGSTKRMISMTALRAWFRTHAGTRALLSQPRLTQNLGNLIHGVLSRHRVEECSGWGQPAVQIGLHKALARGCEPFITLLADLPMWAYLENYGWDDMDTYSRDDNVPKRERWIQPWTELPAHLNAHVDRPLHQGWVWELSSVLSAMESMSVKTTRVPRYPKLTQAYMRAFWDDFLSRPRSTSGGAMNKKAFKDTELYKLGWLMVFGIDWGAEYDDMPIREFLAAHQIKKSQQGGNKFIAGSPMD